MKILRYSIPVFFFAFILPFQAMADSVVPAWANPEFSYQNEAGFALKTKGRIQLDSVWINDDIADHSDGIALRRLRYAVEARFRDHWKAVVDGDFVDDRFSMKDLYIGYDSAYASTDYALSLGHFKEPFGMEQQESSLSILFMERADVDALVPARSSGGMASFYGDRWRMDAGVFTQSVERSSNETQLAFTGRATYAPHFEGIPHLRSHIGIGASWRRMDSVRFRARPEAQITHISTIDTGALQDIDAMALFGLEGALGWKSMLMQAEYISAQVERRDFADADAHGWYVQAGWILTGEQRPYSAKKNAVFGRVEPIRPFNPETGDWGAWEVAFKVSGFDLNNGSIAGGRQHAIVGGLNWYPEAQWRVTGNISKVTTDAQAPTPHDDPLVVGLRVQWFF